MVAQIAHVQKPNRPQMNPIRIVLCCSCILKIVTALSSVDGIARGLGDAGGSELLAGTGTFGESMPHRIVYCKLRRQCFFGDAFRPTEHGQPTDNRKSRPRTHAYASDRR